MKNWSLTARIAVTFAALLLILVAICGVGFYAIGSLNNAAALVIDHQQKALLAIHVGFGEEKTITATRGFLLNGKEETLATSAEGKEEIRAALDGLEKVMLQPKHREQLDDMRNEIEAITRYQDAAIALRRQSQAAKAQEVLLSPEANQIRLALRNNIRELITTQDAERQEALREQQAIQSRTRKLMLALGIVGFLVASILAVSFARSLVHRVRNILGLINEIAGRNLAVADLQSTANDEIGHAAIALNRMKNNLAEILRNIALSTERLASASEEISSSATQQTSGAESQRDQTHQVATAMQEMSSTVVQISENSTRASEISRKASETAHQGGKIVEETLTKMRAIASSVGETAHKVEALGKSSDQIGQIIGVIDDIADQTNLLALNAAIEAARAGEQGRGFAVVADEVRKLAERTSKATKEIASMIQSIQAETHSAVEAMELGTRQVEDGVQTTTKAGTALRDIIQSADQAGEMITHIAAAATQQSSATEEVNNNVDQIAKITAETAEGAQQSAKACHELSSLALDLQNIVSQFKLPSNGAKAASHSRESAARPGKSPGGSSGAFYRDFGASEERAGEAVSDSEEVLTHG